MKKSDAIYILIIVILLTLIIWKFFLTQQVNSPVSNVESQVQTSDNSATKLLPLPVSNTLSPSSSSTHAKPLTATNSEQITVRGWLRSATRLQEVASDYNPNTDNDAYSGRNFLLNFSNSTKCYMYTSQTVRNEISCFDLDEGRGNINDRIKVIGSLSGDRIDVSTLEDVNNLPITQWSSI